MKSISQVAKLTGVSIRTLQYYDEIGLLKPSELTAAGYRMYDDGALQTLQQILFFKELGFPLREIKVILKKPDFDRIAAFKKQKELFLLKRGRLDPFSIQFIINKDVIGIFSPFIDTDVCDDLFFTQETT